MSVIGWTAAIALALQGTGSSTVPLQPSDKWQVAFEDDLCAMARSYDDGRRKLMLAFRPFPMNDRAEVAILVPGGVPIRRDGAATVSFSPGRTLPATFAAYRTSPALRVVHVYLDRTLLGDLAAADTIAITADGNTRSFAIPRAAAALKVLDQCEVSLLKEWGVDPALKNRALAAVQGDPAQYFPPSSYPQEALRAERQGRVVALLFIDDKGAVGQCRIVKSSGVPALDETTCRIAREKVPFAAARDGAGRAVASHYLLPVSWRLPG